MNQKKIKKTQEELTAWFEDFEDTVSCYGDNYYLEHKGLYFLMAEVEADEEGKYIQQIVDTNIDCDHQAMKAILISVAALNGFEHKNLN